jgi:hypothetical protein
MWPDGASLVLGHFAGTKGPRLPGRNPAIQKIAWIFSFVQPVHHVPPQTFLMGKNQGGFPIKTVENDSVGKIF